MRLGLISDVHARAAPVREALELFGREGADEIYCAGDIAGYGDELEATVALLRASGCRAVLGNHDLWTREESPGRALARPVAAYLEGLPLTCEAVIAGRKVSMVHASPPSSLTDGISLLDERGDVIPERHRFWRDILADEPADVLIVGHTHQVFAERLGHPLVVNPGSTCFNHTCAILELPTMEVRFFALSGRKPLLAWNWGLERSEP